MATAYGASGTTPPGRSARAGRKRDGIPWHSPLTEVVKGALYRVFGRLELPAGYRYSTHWQDSTYPHGALVGLAGGRLHPHIASRHRSRLVLRPGLSLSASSLTESDPVPF